jgi:hypothetical protein
MTRASHQGTPMERERARRGWRRSTAYSGTSGHQDIDTDGARSCESCEYMRWPDLAGARKPAPRCAVPQHVVAEAGLPTGLVTGEIATQVTAICLLYQRRQQPAALSTTEQLRILRRAAARLDATEQERTDAEHQIAALDAQQRREAEA